MDDALSPGNPDALRFWRHVFGGQRGYLALFSGHRGSPGSDDLLEPRSHYFEYPERATDALRVALQESAAGREVYFCAHLLSERRRIKENAADVMTLWGDLDGAETPNGELSPTAVIESSPGRYHCYWRLADPIPPRAAESLNKRLARAIGADPSGFDLTQLLRVPGTTNHKYAATPEVSLVELGGTRAYVPSRLDELLPPAEQEHRESPRPIERNGSEPPVALDPEALAVWRGERPKLKDGGEVDRSGTLLKIGRVLFDAGANRSVIVGALAERDEALGWRKYAGRRDAAERFHEIVDELEHNGRTPRLISEAGKEDSPPTDDELRDRYLQGGGHDLAYGLGKWRRYENGVWPEADEFGIRQGICDVLEEAKEQKIRPTSAKLQSVTELTRVKVALPDGLWDADPDILVCANGALNLRTRELLPHARHHYVTEGVPFDYGPKAYSEVWEQRVMGEIVAENLGLETVMFLQEFAGYCLITDCGHEIAIWLTGPMGGGRSTIIEGFRSMLGPTARFTVVGPVDGSQHAQSNLGHPGR